MVESTNKGRGGGEERGMEKEGRRVETLTGWTPGKRSLRGARSLWAIIVPVPR